jgi:hypothetical protein
MVLRRPVELAGLIRSDSDFTGPISQAFIRGYESDGVLRSQAIQMTKTPVTSKIMAQAKDM